MNSNQGNNQQQKQSGGYKISPTKESSNSTKRRTPSRSRGPHPFQNQAELQRVMSLFQ